MVFDLEARVETPVFSLGWKKPEETVKGEEKRGRQATGADIGL